MTTVIPSGNKGGVISKVISLMTTVGREREKQMLKEYNLKFSNLLAEKDSLIKKLRAEKRALQEGRHFIKENITSRYEEVIKERETLMREKIQEISNISNELSRAEANIKDLEHSTNHLRSLLQSREEELKKMKDLNMENTKLKRDKAENDRKMKALEEKLLKEIAKNKNLHERKYEKHLEEIDKIVEKYCKNIDSTGNEDIKKKLEELQESFVSRQNYEAEIRRREKESVNLKEKLKVEEKNVSDLTKETGTLKCHLEKLRAELDTCKRKLDDAETRLSDEESIQKGEVGCAHVPKCLSSGNLCICFRSPGWRRSSSSSSGGCGRWRTPLSVSAMTASS